MKFERKRIKTGFKQWIWKLPHLQIRMLWWICYRSNLNSGNVFQPRLIFVNLGYSLATQVIFHLTVWKGILLFGVWLKNRGMAFLPHPPLFLPPPLTSTCLPPTPFILCTPSLIFIQHTPSKIWTHNLLIWSLSLNPVSYWSYCCKYPWSFSYKFMSKFGN